MHARYAWPKNPATFSAKAWRAFAALRDGTRQTARIWAMKASLRHLWDYTNAGAACTCFRRWYGWALRSRLEPMKQVARMLKSHRENTPTYLAHWITNAVTEGLSAKIPWIKFGARGSRNLEAFTMVIYFHCGGLHLEPRVG
jgi:transposase